MRWVLAVALLTAFALTGCGGAADTQASDLASQYGLHLDGRTTSGEQTLPADLSSLPWAQYQHASRGAGFDLKPYRGQELTFAAYRLKEGLHEHPATLWTVEHDGTIVGAYVVAESEAGGIYSLPDVKREL